MWKYCDTISSSFFFLFFPSFFILHTHTAFLFLFFPFFYSSTHVPLHFSFFTSFFFCNLPLPPNSRTFQLSFFLFFFFFFFLSPFSLSTSFLPLLKIYPYSFLFFFLLSSFFPLLFSTLCFFQNVPQTHRALLQSFFLFFFFFFFPAFSLSTSSVTPMQGIDFFFFSLADLGICYRFFCVWIWKFVIERAEQRDEMRGMRDNMRTDDLINSNLVIAGRAQRIASKHACTFCLWTSRAP